MKTERIQIGEVYMAIIKGNEVRVRVDMLQLDHVIGTNIDAGRGIICPATQILAGPLKGNALNSTALRSLTTEARLSEPS